MLGLVIAMTIMISPSVRAEFIVGQEHAVKQASMLVKNADGVFAPLDNQKIQMTEMRSDATSQLKLAVDLNVPNLVDVTDDTRKLLRKITFNVIDSSLTSCGSVYEGQRSIQLKAAYMTDDLSLTLSDQSAIECHAENRWTAEVVYLVDGIILGKIELVGNPVAVFHTL